MGARQQSGTGGSPAELHGARDHTLDLVQHLDAIVWEVGLPLWRFTFVSQRAETLLGYPLGRWLAEPDFWAGLVHPDDVERILSLRRVSVEDGKDYQADYRLIDSAGAIVWVRDAVRLGFDDLGRPDRLRGVTVDISALKRAELELRDRDARHRSLVDNVKHVIFQTDARGIWTFLNAAWTEITGFTSEESIGVNFLKFVHPDDRAQMFRPFLNARSDYFGLTIRCLTKIGDVRWMEVFARLILTPGGRIVGTAGTMTDITERKRAEGELVAARARLRHLLISSPAVLYSRMASGDYAFTFVSENVTSQLGWEVHEVLEDRRFWADRVHPDDAPRVFAELAQLAAHEQHSHEYRFRHGDGTIRWIRDERKLVCDSSGKPIEIVGSWTDVTRRKRAEEAHAQLEDQLRQAQKMEAVGRLAGGVAHDFNNLLTVITGRCELLLRRLGEGDPLSRDANLVLEAARRAGALTRHLLAFSRKQVLAPKVLDLNVIVADTETILQRLIGEDVELVTILGAPVGRVKADQGQIEQVIMNLAVNARDAMPNGGRLSIETATVTLADDDSRVHPGMRPGAYVLLRVSDTGCGMDAETMSHLFEPFFTTKGPGKGTGLGLCTVYGIVKQSGGDIRVASELGKGTTFKIYLPRLDDEVEAMPPAIPASGASTGSETVLLVEDEDAIRDLAQEILRMNGYVVLAAASCEDALHLAAHHPGPIHLLMTDVIMPQMDGRRLAQRIAPLRPDMKVLYVSGYTDDAIAQHGVLEPGTEFLQKPFTPDALAARVRRILDVFARPTGRGCASGGTPSPAREGPDPSAADGGVGA
jgi:PAS domain S-box-containing protein